MRRVFLLLSALMLSLSFIASACNGIDSAHCSQNKMITELEIAVNNLISPNSQCYPLDVCFPDPDPAWYYPGQTGSAFFNEQFRGEIETLTEGCAEKYTNNYYWHSGTVTSCSIDVIGNTTSDTKYWITFYTDCGSCATDKRAIYTAVGTILKNSTQHTEYNLELDLNSLNPATIFGDCN